MAGMVVEDFDEVLDLAEFVGFSRQGASLGSGEAEEMEEGSVGRKDPFFGPVVAGIRGGLKCGTCSLKGAWMGMAPEKIALCGEEMGMCKRGAKKGADLGDSLFNGKVFGGLLAVKFVDKAQVGTGTERDHAEGDLADLTGKRFAEGGFHE